MLQELYLCCSLLLPHPGLYPLCPGWSGLLQLPLHHPPLQVTVGYITVTHILVTLTLDLIPWSWLEQCTMPYCTVLYCAQMYYTVLYCTVMSSTVLYCYSLVSCAAHFAFKLDQSLRSLLLSSLTDSRYPAHHYPP